MTRAKGKRRKQNLPSSSDSDNVQTSEDNRKLIAKSKKKEHEENLQIIEDELETRAGFDFSKFSEMHFRLYPNANFKTAHSALFALEEDFPRLTVAT